MSNRIAADSRPVLAFTVAGTLAVALAAFALSFAALRDAALWGRVPENLAFLVPVVIDASVLVYGLVALVLRARGRSTAWAWTLMFGFTVVSIGANAAHAYNVPAQVQALVGVVLVALAPLSVLTSTHALASLVVADEPPAPVAEPVTTGEAVARPVTTDRPRLEATTETTPEPAPEPAPVPAAEPNMVPVPRRAALRPAPRATSSLAQDTLPGLEPAGVTA